MENEKYINQKNVPKLGTAYKRFTINNGIVKEFKFSPLASKIISKELIWYKLSDLPQYLQDLVEDKALTAEEIRNLYNKGTRKQEFYDSEGTRIYVTDTTEIIPVVDNFLPQDGIYAYTVVVKDNKITLKPILSSPHWSDIFAGNTEFGYNVFCLASDLTPEQRAYFQNEIIQLKDAINFLEEIQKPKL